MNVRSFIAWRPLFFSPIRTRTQQLTQTRTDAKAITQVTVLRVYPDLTL